MLRSAAAVFGGVLLLAILVTWETTLSMVGLWLTTDTYMHGILVLPLALILACRIANESTNLRDVGTDTPSWWSAGLVISAWLLICLAGKFAMANIVQQFAVFSLFPLLTYLSGGWGLVKRYAVPLSLLFFAVPFGDFMVPHLQSITADMSVWMLLNSGVSVVHNGWYISIPAADFRVAEACSGINFLISTFTLSVFYAFLYLQGAARRILFMVLGALVPLIANGVRVYLIIMIAHWGNVEAATGFDHLVYGWVFFVLVLIMLFIIGHYLQPSNDVPLPSMSVADFLKHLTKTPLPPFAQKAAASVVVALLLVGALSVTGKNDVAIPANYLPVAQNDPLSPRFPQADSFLVKQQDSGWREYRAFYADEHVDKKLIGYQNVWINENSWSISQIDYIKLANGISVRKWVLTNLSGQRYQLLFSYCVGGDWYASDMMVKLAQVWGKASRSDFGGVGYGWFAPLEQSVNTLEVPECTIY